MDRSAHNASTGEAPISGGFESLLPVKYSNSTVVCGVYLVSSSIGERALQDAKLHPVILPGNRSIVVVTLFDFRVTSIGPYRELSIGVLAVPEPVADRRLRSALSMLAVAGAWVVALPVSSELACQAGIELFGYPKTVNRIDVRYMSNTCSATVHEGLHPVLGLSFPLRGALPVPVPRLLTYSRLGDDLLETKISTHWFPRLCSGRDARISALQPEHKLAKEIEALRLPPEPLFVLHGDGFEANLNRGTCVGSRKNSIPTNGP